MAKVKCWGIRQAIWGTDSPATYWFTSQTERDLYLAEHDHCDKLRCRMIDEDSTNVFADYESWKKTNDPSYPWNN